MKFLRRILIFLAWVLALLVLGVLVLLTPPAQSWIAEREIEKLTGLHATVGTMTASFSSFHATEIRLEHRGAVLIIPSVDVSLPLKSALWDRKVLIGKLVATGWTLELGETPGRAKGETQAITAPAPAAAGRVAPAEMNAARGFAHLAREFVRGRKLPCDLSLGGVELEGEIVMKSSAAQRATALHVTLKGGGLAAGRTGEFALDATGALKTKGAARAAVAPRGRFVVAMGSPHIVQQIAFDGHLSSADRLLPEDFTLSASVAAAGAVGNETYLLKFSREGRSVASIEARFPMETRRLAGTWKIDLEDSDLARFTAGQVAPLVAASGGGRFDCDATFNHVHLAGQMDIRGSRLANLVPSWSRVGAVAVNAEFDLVQSGPALRFDRLSFSVGGTQPIALARALRPFELNVTTMIPKPAAPDTAWLAVSLLKFPLAWLPEMAGGFSFADGEARGEITVKTVNGGLSLNSNDPLVARGVTVQRAGGQVGQTLDLSAPLKADSSAQGWRVQWAPLLVESAGQRLASIETTWSPGATAGQPAVLTGKWQADLAAMAASGEFSASLGTSLNLSSKLTAVGHAPERSVTANLQARFDPSGGVALHGPVTITSGGGASEFSVDARWTKEKAAPRVDLAVDSVDASLEHLGLLAAGVVAADGRPISSKGKDQRPFWGEWAGQAKLGIYRLRTGELDLNEVAGTLDFDRGAIRLTGGSGRFVPPGQPATAKGKDNLRPPKEEPASRTTLEGAVSFDASAEFPYRLNVTASVDTVDSARLFDGAKSGRDPVIEGRFSVAGTFTGSGLNLDDLVQRRREEFRLKSNAGILRLLKTDVAGSLPEAATPMKDALGTVGGMVETIMGLSRNTINSGKRNVSKETDAVLNFTYQTAEIGYDEFTLTAVRGADRGIDLTTIAVSSPHVRLTGSGRINFGSGQPLRARPFSLELQLSASGQTAELLSTARLLSDGTEQPGFRMLHQSIHFGGTMEQIDGSQWRELLVKAAQPAPANGKKGG